MKYTEYLDQLLCAKGQNPGLLSGEWALLHALCAKFDESVESAYAMIAESLADPTTSGPLVRAMKAIGHDHLEIMLYGRTSLWFKQPT